MNELFDFYGCRGFIFLQVKVCDKSSNALKGATGKVPVISCSPSPIISSPIPQVVIGETLDEERLRPSRNSKKVLGLL